MASSFMSTVVSRLFHGGRTKDRAPRPPHHEDSVQTLVVDSPSPFPPSSHPRGTKTGQAGKTRHEDQSSQPAASRSAVKKREGTKRKSPLLASLRKRTRPLSCFVARPESPPGTRKTLFDDKEERERLPKQRGDKKEEGKQSGSQQCKEKKPRRPLSCIVQPPSPRLLPSEDPYPGLFDSGVDLAAASGSQTTRCREAGQRPRPVSCYVDCPPPHRPPPPYSRRPLHPPREERVLAGEGSPQQAVPRHVEASYRAPQQDVSSSRHMTSGPDVTAGPPSPQSDPRHAVPVAVPQTSGQVMSSYTAGQQDGLLHDSQALSYSSQSMPYKSHYLPYNQEPYRSKAPPIKSEALSYSPEALPSISPEVHNSEALPYSVKAHNSEALNYSSDALPYSVKAHNPEALNYSSDALPFSFKALKSEALYYSSEALAYSSKPPPAYSSDCSPSDGPSLALSQSREVPRQSTPVTPSHTSTQRCPDPRCVLDPCPFQPPTAASQSWDGGRYQLRDYFPSSARQCRPLSACFLCEPGPCCVLDGGRERGAGRGAGRDRPMSQCYFPGCNLPWAPPAPTRISTSTPTPTLTITPTPVSTPAATFTMTPTPLSTPSPTPTMTPTPVSTPAATLTMTPTPMSTPSPTPTITPTPVSIPAPTLTMTPTPMSPPSPSLAVCRAQGLGYQSQPASPREGDQPAEDDEQAWPGGSQSAHTSRASSEGERSSLAHDPVSPAIPAERSPVPAAVTPVPAISGPIPARNSPIPAMSSPIPARNSPIPAMSGFTPENSGSPIPTRSSPPPAERRSHISAPSSPIPAKRNPIPAKGYPIPAKRSAVPRPKSTCLLLTGPGRWQEDPCTADGETTVLPPAPPRRPALKKYRSADCLDRVDELESLAISPPPARPLAYFLGHEGDRDRDRDRDGGYDEGHRDRDRDRDGGHHEGHRDRDHHEGDRGNREEIFTSAEMLDKVGQPRSRSHKPRPASCMLGLDESGYLSNGTLGGSCWLGGLSASTGDMLQAVGGEEMLGADDEMSLERSNSLRKAWSLCSLLRQDSIQDRSFLVMRRRRQRMKDRRHTSNTNNDNQRSSSTETDDGLELKGGYSTSSLQDSEGKEGGESATIAGIPLDVGGSRGGGLMTRLHSTHLKAWQVRLRRRQMMRRQRSADRTPHPRMETLV